MKTCYEHSQCDEDVSDIFCLLSFTQVRGFVKKAQSSQPSLNDSLDGEIQAFLIDEDQLHTYDDLTKVNPVTPSTGNKQG